MWQSQIENVHSIKIEFNIDSDASAIVSLAPLCLHAMSYRQQNTTHFGIAAIVIFAASAKLGRQDGGKERFACLEGYLLTALIERRAKAKGQ